MGYHVYTHEPRFSSSHQEPTKEPCSLCQSNEGNLELVYYSPTDSDWDDTDNEETYCGMTANDLFHAECSECSNIQTDPLCQFCAHMRLGHLARCILVSKYDAKSPIYRRYRTNTNFLKSFEFNLGTLNDVQKRSTSCQTCGTFASHATSIANQNRFSSQTMIRLDVELDPGVIRGIKYELVIELSLEPLEASIVAPIYRTTAPSPLFISWVSLSS